MIKQKPDIDTVTAGKEVKPKRHVKALRYVIYTTYFLSLFLLLSVLLAIAANRKAQPFYSWIEGTRLERYGHAVAGLIIEKKVSMQVDARNDSLSPEEQSRFSQLVKNNQFQNSSLEPRDKRLILEYSNLEPALEGDYLILTPEDCEEKKRFAEILDRLFSTFVNELSGCGLELNVQGKPHICFFENRKQYLKATESESKCFHDSLGYFSPINNCLYFFSRNSSLEGLELQEKFTFHREKGRDLYKGKQLESYMLQLDIKETEHMGKLQDETFCTLRHEATHQLAHMYGLHSNKGFENKWLTEGIAQYFETEKPGDIRRQKKLMLIKYMEEKTLYSWPELTNSDEGTFADSGHKERQLAYSQSWFLVRYLMENHRQELIEFIKWKKNPGILNSPMKDFDQLCLLLKKSPEAFSQELADALGEL